MLGRNLESIGEDYLQWQELNFGAPTILALAGICRRSMARENHVNFDELNATLTNEAKTLLVLARERGTMDIRAMVEGFDSAERFLAICVEVELNQWKLFLDKNQPEQTIRFIDGFRQLCLSGLVMHHLQKDFSLTPLGFDFARTLNKADFEDSIAFAQEVDH